MTINPKKQIIPLSRMKSLQTDWSIDALLEGLAKCGVDVCVRCSRVSDNEVSILLQTNLSTKARKKLNDLMYELYKIE